MEHLAEHPHVVTVRLDVPQPVPWADELVEDFEVLFSILKFTDEETIAMQETSSAFLSDSLAVGAGTVVTLIRNNEFCCENKSEREYWFSLGNTISLLIKAGELSVNVNPTGSLSLCVMHVQYEALSMSDLERVSLRVTPSIEFCAHQDKCRNCGLCTNRKVCKWCKGAYKANFRCGAHDDCSHCPEFKWQEGYGKQYVKDGCTAVASILSRVSKYSFQLMLLLNDARERRFAFIVGNTQYLGEEHGSDFEPLGDVVIKDVRDICRQLKKLGFQVHGDEPLLNQNKADLVREIENWTRGLPENAEALVFLSGHGMELHGNHYFVSVDCTHLDENVVEMARRTCITIEWIRDRLLGQALCHEGPLMSFWDCCSEDVVEQMKVKVV